MPVVLPTTHLSSRRGTRRALLSAILALLLLLILSANARAAELTDAEVQNPRCLTCHAQSHIGEITGPERYQMIAPNGVSPAAEAAPRPELYIPENRLAGSVHGKIPCVSCHVEARTLPHAPHMSPASCDTSCHPKATAAFLHSSHAAALASGDTRAPRCATCHGGHDILPKADRQSRIFPLNVVQTCGNCHEKHVPKTANGLDGAKQVASYLESVHGQAVLKAGLTVSATCADCHGNHDIRPSKDPESRVNRVHIPDTCGRCHVGVAETYIKSIHGTLLAEGNQKAPVCSDCHTAHAISRIDTPAFKMDIVAECGSCHDKPRPGERISLYDTYRASYHGQVLALGSTRAARCSDCHGAHDITRVSDPSSQLNAENKITTCRKCHTGADAKFAGFDPHADFRNSNRNPLLHYVFLYFVFMMSASFGFFGLHCIFWLVRSIIDRLKGSPNAVRIKPDYSKGAIQRFNRVDRVNHGFVIITFFGLALTGLPLFYSDKGWGQNLAAIFGGPHACGIFHRIFAVMLIGNFVVHAVGVYRRFRKYGLKPMLFGPTTMLPRIKDFTDCLAMFRYFFTGTPKPKFDRWTYWEKFDYVAEVGGSGIIGLSGLLLWFPVFFSAFVPGWAFNVAMIVHGFEALLAVGFIFTIHFFNAHLRLEKFPVDDVMFTGRLPENEFKHERQAEYERVVATGEIQKLRVKAPNPWYRHFAVALGITAMIVGTTIIALIILAALRII